MESSRATAITEKIFAIVVNCDGMSKVTDGNLEHPSKIESPRVEMEEGTVKEARPQLQNAPDSILRTVAGHSKTISARSGHNERLNQAPMKRTEFGI
jgi:hypothetical protein